MSKRLAAVKALEQLRQADDTQSIASDENDDYLDSDDLDDESNTINDEEDFLFDESSDDENDIDGHDEAIQSKFTSSLTDSDPNLDLSSKDGIIWKKIKNGDELSTRKKIKFNEKIGPTSYATRNIDGTKLSAFLAIFDISMINLILNCTNTNAENFNSNLSLEKNDILAFIGVLFFRGVFCPNTPTKTMWDKSFGIPIISKLMTRNKFLTIMKYLRFDVKSDRSERVQSDKFCMIRELWNKFVENSMSCYRPGQHLTVDEQLLPSKNRCSFIQYMPKKPDKFGIKSWMLADVETKYILNCFPYLGKDSDRQSEKLLGEYVVEKLMVPYKNKGHCVTSDNFFTSLRLIETLIKQKTTFVGTMRKNKRELPSIDSVL